MELFFTKYESKNTKCIQYTLRGNLHHMIGTMDLVQVFSDSVLFK